MTKRNYRQFCPTARALDVVGERWTLLIVRDLLLGPKRYSELRRTLPGMASNLLAGRLSEMEAADLVRKHHRTEPSAHDVYVLTDRGREVEPVLLALARFGLPYLDVPTDDQPMVAERVPLGLVALLHPAELPDEPFRARFDLDEGDHVLCISAQRPPGTRLDPTERVTVRPSEPDEQVDVSVRGSLAHILWIRQGVITLEALLTDGALQLEGRAAARTTLRRLYRLDPVAAGARG